MEMLGIGLNLSRWLKGGECAKTTYISTTEMTVDQKSAAKSKHKINNDVSCRRRPSLKNTFSVLFHHPTTTHNSILLH